MSRKSRAATEITEHSGSGDLWQGAGWRLLVTVGLLATIAGLIMLAGSMKIG